MLKKINWSTGNSDSSDTKRGKNVRKKIDSLGLKRFINTALIIIFSWSFDWSEFSKNSDPPDSFHIEYARYRRYTAPMYFIDWKTAVLYTYTEERTHMLNSRWGIIPAVQPNAAAILLLHPLKRPVEMV